MGSVMGSSPSVQTMNTQNPMQQGLMSELGNIVQGQLGQGVPITQSPLQTSAYGTALNQGNNVQNYAGQIAGGQGQLLSLENNLSDLSSSLNPVKQNLSSLESGLAPTMQPFNAGQSSAQFGAQVAAPAMNNFTQNVTPGIMEQFAAYGGANSGGARKALADAGVNLETNLSGQKSAFMQNQQQQSLQNLVSGTSLSGQLAGQQGTLTGLQGNLTNTSGNLVQDSSNMTKMSSDIINQILQGGLSAGSSQFNVQQASQPWNNPYLQYLMPLISEQTQTAVADPGQSSGIGGILGGLGSIGGALGGTSGLLAALPAAI